MATSEPTSVLVEPVMSYLETASAQTTGGHVWEAARTMHEFFKHHPHLLASRPSVVELGSGTGFLGMSLARDFALSEIVLTEMVQDGALQWLDRNVQKNREAGLDLALLSTTALDWSWADDSNNGAVDEPDSDASAAREASEAIFTRAWDLVVGSDLVYNEIGVYMLPKVLRRLLVGSGSASTTRAYYAHTLNRFEFLDRDFLKALTAEGLQYVQVWPEGEADGGDGAGVRGEPQGDGGDESDEDGGFSGELFPEQKIVVFRIESRR